MQTTTPRLWTRDFYLLVGSTFLVWTCHYLLVLSLPLYAAGQLGASPPQIGSLLAMLAGSAIFSRLAAGYALDRFGRHRIHVAFALLFALIAAVYRSVPSIGALILLRLAHGIPFGVTTTSADTIASDLTPEGRRGEGLGYFGLANSLAMLLGPALAWPALDRGAFAALFAVAALAAAGGAVLAWPIRCPAVACDEPAAVRPPLITPSVGLVATLMLFMALGYGSLMSFAGLYGSELGIANASLFFPAYAVGYLLAGLFGGRLFDQHGPRLAVGAGLGLLALSCAALGLWQAPAGFFSAALGQGLGYGMVSNAALAMAVNLAPPSRRGAATAMVFVMFNVGITVSTPLLGWVAQATGSYAWMFLTVAGTMVVAAVVSFTVILPRYARRHSR
jgi:MFS family permease